MGAFDQSLFTPDKLVIESNVCRKGWQGGTPPTFPCPPHCHDIVAGPRNWAPTPERYGLCSHNEGFVLETNWGKSVVSLVAQMEKNLPAMQKTWVRSLDWEDPPEEGMATHSSILSWRISIDRGAWWATVHGVTKS